MEGMRSAPSRTLRPSRPSDEEGYLSFCVYRDFHHFVEVVWHNPLYTITHHALELRRISVNLRLDPRLPFRNENPGVPAFVDLIFRFFHRLTRLIAHAAQSPYAKNYPHYSLLLEKEAEQFDEEAQLTSVATHTEKFEAKVRGSGFKYQWLGEDVAERCFGIGKRVRIGDDLIERKKIGNS